jgi:DNA-binding response OmpR family regulator
MVAGPAARDVLLVPVMKDGLDQSNARRPRVILAEDDDNMRALVADILRDEGLDVEEVPDGRSLLLRLGEAVLRRRRGTGIDLVVSDVRMPFCSGLDVLKKIALTHGATPVLLMTAFSERGLDARVRELGGRLLDKPFTPLALRQAVRELLVPGTGSY